MTTRAEKLMILPPAVTFECLPILTIEPAKKINHLEIETGQIVGVDDYPPEMFVE